MRWSCARPVAAGSRPPKSVICASQFSRSKRARGRRARTCASWNRPLIRMPGPDRQPEAGLEQPGAEVARRTRGRTPPRQVPHLARGSSPMPVSSRRGMPGSPGSPPGRRAAVKSRRRRVAERHPSSSRGICRSSPNVSTTSTSPATSGSCASRLLHAMHGPTNTTASDRRRAASASRAPWRSSATRSAQRHSVCAGAWRSTWPRGRRARGRDQAAIRDPPRAAARYSAPRGRRRTDLGGVRIEPRSVPASAARRQCPGTRPETRRHDRRDLAARRDQPARFVHAAAQKFACAASTRARSCRIAMQRSAMTRPVPR